jgi:hypothetical protein
MATPTYTPIQTQTLGSAAATVTFSSFSGYTDLKLVMTAKTSDTSGYFQIFPNNDTGSNYSRTLLQGDGTSATSNRNSNSSNGLQMNCATSSQDVNSYPTIVDFMNYSNTTTAKTALARAGSTSVGLVEAYVWLYRSPSNAAITSLVIKANTTTFAAGSTFTLYGIANAAIGAPKATGGIITYDSTYYYHTFGASGTFTPQQSLTADILVVAGGGGGGSNLGAGGGAGGVLGFASQSLTATGYTVTIGNGGAGSSSSGAKGSSGGNSTFGALTTATGGGGGGSYSDPNGASGGSGGGGAGIAAGSGGTGSQGNNGAAGNSYAAGGGGGYGSAGSVAASSGQGGSGGSSTSTVTNLSSILTWLSATGIGVGGTIAGGAGGCSASSQPGGLSGGGGAGVGALDNGSQNSTAGTGVANTGSGGGGGSRFTGPGGSGGSGVVIVRYLKA